VCFVSVNWKGSSQKNVITWWGFSARPFLSKTGFNAATQGTPTEGKRLSTIDLLIKAAYLKFAL